MLICDSCGEPIDRAKIDLGQQAQFAPGVDIHPPGTSPSGRDCHADFLAAVQEVAKRPRPTPPPQGGR